MANQLLYLSKADVMAAGVTMPDVISLLEDAFVEKGHDRVQMPPKPGIYPGSHDNFMHAMPAYIPGLGAAGIKWVSGFPENPKRDLPYINGLLILNDPETGVPLAVMDCVWLTGMRTGAASAVAARRLARPDAAVLGILGCGVQGRTHVEALNVLFPLTHVRAYDVVPQAARAFAEEIQARFDLPVEIASSPEQAIAGSDLVVTAGPILKQPHATIQAGWLEEGAFASLVDFDSYWHPSALHEVDKFCTDDRAQMLHYKELGWFQDIPQIHADLGELVLGRKPGREHENERTMTCNLGLAMDDMAVAPTIYTRAVERGVGTWLNL